MMKKDGKKNTLEKEMAGAGKSEVPEKKEERNRAAVPVEINKRKVNAYKRRQNRLGYLFMLPWIIGFVIFTLFPFAATIYLSFTDEIGRAHV